MEAPLVPPDQWNYNEPVNRNANMRFNSGGGTRKSTTIGSEAHAMRCKTPEGFQKVQGDDSLLHTGPYNLPGGDLHRHQNHGPNAPLGNH
jgi:hypothetical protein